MKVSAIEVHRLVRRRLRAFGLDRLWVVGVRVNARPDDCRDDERRDHLAFIEVLDGYYHARLEVNSYGVTSRAQLDEVVAHEVAHVALWRLASIAEASVPPRLREVVEAEVEQAVELVSRALSCVRKRRKGR